MTKVTKRIVSILLGCIILLCCTACDDAEIHSFSINDLPDKSIGVGVTSDELKVEVDYFRSFQTSDVNVVIEDDSIISIDYEAKESLMSGYYVSYTITGLQAGTTSYYFETADHMIKSDEVEIEVVDDVVPDDIAPDDENSESDQERTFEVVRKFVELYNEKLDPDILTTEELIIEDRLLKYDGAYAIKGDIAGEYILIMNCGSWEIKDEMSISTYADTPEEIIKILCNISTAIDKPLTENEISNTKQYLDECFSDDGKGYTEWTSIGNIRYFSRYLSQGKTYELQIEFSVDAFYK